MGIQRWTETACVQKGAEFSQEMRPFDKGMYVLFTDHEQVVANLTKNHKENLDSWLAQRQEIDRLRAELAAKSKDAERLHRAIGIVCEGFTLPDDVRKILEKALWSDAVMGEGNGR